MPSKSEKVKLGNRHAVVELASERRAPTPAETTVIALKLIRLDGGTQNRAALSEAVVAEYFEIMADAQGWGAFPPAEVTYDGQHYWLTDGFHRIAAAARLADDKLAVSVLVTPGTRQEAVLRSLSANARHGLRRSIADKRRAVVRMLSDREFGWSQFTDQVIAQHCAVSPRYVGKVRDDLEFEGTIEPVAVRTGQDGRAINVAAIGRRAEPVTATPVWQVAAEVAEPVLVLEEVFAPQASEAAPALQQAALLPKFEYVSLLLARDLVERLHEAGEDGALRAYLTPSQSDHLDNAIRKALQL